MYELTKTTEVTELIGQCKSDSGISGPILARAHQRLGELLGLEMDFSPEDTTVVAILRGGMFFAQGLYFSLGCRFDLYDPKQPGATFPESGQIILVDSVIHSGKTLERIFSAYPEVKERAWVASCVCHEGAVDLLGDRLFTVRCSKNSFQGCDIKTQQGQKGPDTTMRLFHQL